MKAERIKKAQGISHKIVSEFLVSHVNQEDKDFWIITVTDTKISSDLSYIDIYVSSLRNSELLTKFLSDYAHDIHHLLAKKIDFLKVPRVRFRYDTSGENFSQVYSIIQEIEEK